MSSEVLIYALHGFLGKGSDWNVLKNILHKEDSSLGVLDINFIAEDLFDKNNSKPFNADIFVNFFSKRLTSIESFKGKKIFIGYSLGGRLGLQILEKMPEVFDHYIFLSTNSGLPQNAFQDRQIRIQNDLKWSEKISTENWDLFLNEWNSQTIFRGSHSEMPRDLNDYDLFKLKEALNIWSLGKQDDFSEVIRNNNFKITWMVGDRDQKFYEMAIELKKNKVLTDFVKIASGHRLCLDNAEAVFEVLKKVLKKI